MRRLFAFVLFSSFALRALAQVHPSANGANLENAARVMNSEPANPGTESVDPSRGGLQPVALDFDHLKSSNGDATGAGGQRKIVRGSDSTFYLVYPDSGRILYTKSTNNGTSWSSEVSISDTLLGCRYPSITERSGSLYVVWQRANGSNWDVVYSYSTNGGSTWHSPVTYVSSVYVNSYYSTGPMPTIMVSSPSAPFDLLMVWSSTGAGGLQSARDTSATPGSSASWTFTSRIPSTSTDSRWSSLAYNYGASPRYFSLAWDDGHGNIYSENTSGSSWSGSARLVSYGAPVGYGFGPSVAYSSTYAKYTAWSASVSGRWSIVTVKDSSSVFRVISDTARNLSWPSLSGNVGNKATLAWYDNNNTSWYTYVVADTLQNKGTQIATSSIFPSLSILNPPGGTAKCVTTSTSGYPYAIQIPTNKFQKAAPEQLAPAERIISFVSENGQSRCALGIRQIFVKTRSGITKDIRLAPLSDDGAGLQASPWDYLRSSNIALPVDAESIILESRMSGPDSSATAAAVFQTRMTIRSATSGQVVATHYSDEVSLRPGAKAIVNRTSMNVESLKGAGDPIVSLDLNGTEVSGGRLKANLIEILAPKSSTVASENTNESNPAGLAVPGEYRLSAYPNPFNPTTTIQFDLPSAGFVKVVIFDVLGREVAKLSEASMTSGSHSVVWDGRNVSSGMYFARMTVVDPSGRSVFSKTSKLLLSK